MKVCNVGARTALTQKFIDNGAINEDLKVLDLNKVISTNDKLKSQLKNSFGIDRSIVNLNSKGEYISFNADVFNEIDALHGIYNDENKKYHKDYTNDNTLTPFQLISKYLDPASNDVGFTVSGELTQESLDKFKLGMSNEYPNILVKAVPTKIVDGEQKYKVALEKIPDAQPGAESMAIPGGLDQVYDNVDKDVVMKTIAPLLSKFKNADVIWVSAADMNNILKNDPRVLIAKDKVVNAAAIGNKIYLVEGAVTTNTALEELMHLFVDSLLTQRKALFQGLVNEASANYPHILAQVEADYAGFSAETKKIELVTRALRDAYVDERIKNPEGITKNQFLKLAREFFKWLNSKFEDLFGLSFNIFDNKLSDLNFKNTLWRGQAQKPIVDEDGNLILSPSYELLSKNTGKSFSTKQNVAVEYGKRYSQTPYIIKINEDYLLKHYNLVDEDVEGEKRVISSNKIVIPKGQYSIIEPTLHNSDESIDKLIRRYIESLGFANSADELNLAEVGKYYESKDLLLNTILKRLNTDKRGLMHYVAKVNNNSVNQNFNDIVEHGLNPEDLYVFQDNVASSFVKESMNMYDPNYIPVQIKEKNNSDNLQITIGQLAAYLNINDVEMPDVETVEPRFNLSAANEEFDQDAFDAEQPDPKNKTIKEKKLQRIKSQIRRLEKIKASLKGEKNKAMAETIDKLIENSKEYQTLINDDTATVSVTKFVGSPEFPENISKVYKKYQDFGNFIHAFMEELQLKALALDLTPTQLLVTKPEFFDKFFDKHEDLISIPGLTKKKLFSHIALVVEKAGSSINNSEIVIPEITVHGVDSLGRVVDGRLDYIVVRQDGSVSIKDYKTTRSKFPMSRYNDSALTKLYSTKQLIEGVHPAFERFSGRSKVSGFLSQIGAYRRLLAQSGITSKGDSIINIIYSPDKTKLEDEDEWVYDKMFVNEVFVDGEYGLTMDKDENGNPIGELNPIAKRIIESLHAAIPVEGEETNTAAEEKVQEEINYIASLPNEKVKLLLDNLKAKIKLQLDNINTEISKAEIARADETTIRSLKERRALLREAQSWFDRTFKEGDEFVNVPDELILKGLLDKTKELAKSLSLDSERIYKEGDVKKTIQVLSSRNSQFNDLQNFLEAFQHALIYNAEISSDNPLIQEINQAIVDIKNGQSWYIKVAGEQFEKVLLRVPKVNADRMIQSMRLMLEPKKAKLERIINGDTSVIDEKGMWFSGKLKRVISFLSGSPKTITQDMKEAAQEELTRINNFMKHPEYNKEFVKMYVENTFENPQSGFYIGSTVQQGFGGFTSDDFRSAYGNPELAITAMANYAIQMTEEAHAKFFEEMSKIDIDNIVKQFTSKYGSYQAGNQALSEKVSIKDLETGESEEYMMYNNPILRQFFDEYDEFDYAIRKKGEEIKKLRESDLPQDQKDLQVKQLNKERDELKTKANDWRIENTETKLVPELYKLEVTLPEEIQEKINGMNQSIAAIKLNAKNQDWNLTESMLEDIKRYEFEISQLRKLARESNPEIDAILEKINEYYDYHVNEGLFEYNRDQVLKKFGEQSTEYKLWLERNSDLVPSSAWFDRIMELSEEKREIYGDDPEITALYEQRKELMNKYKYKSRFSSTNVFNPMFMSEEDMNALNEIDDAIDEYFGTKEPVKLDKEDNARVIEINKELGAIKQTINKPEFTRQLNEKIDEIIRLNTEIGKESDPERKTHLEAQLKNKDLEFKAWYERNNTGKYKLGTIVQKGSVVAAPRKFNQISVPTDPGLMTRVPNSMYRTRSYKEAAYNPNYSPTLEKRRYGQDSYAMPKGIAYDKATGRFIVDKNSKWANPKYVSMMNDNALMDFYNKFVMDQYYNKQINMSAQKLGFFFPAVQQKAFDTIATDGFEGIKREGREMVNDIVRSGNTSEFDKADNKYGVAGQNRVRFSHNYLQPASIVTKDGINAIIQWNLQYEINQSMEEANLALSPMVDFLKARKVEVKDEIAKKQIDKVIEIFEFERNKFIYGQTFAPSKDFEKSVINRKTMRQFMTAVSWGRLAFDPAMQVGNLVSGNVQAFLASQMKEVGMGSTEDFLFAKNQIYGTGQFFYNIISDYGKINDISLSTKILRFFNPTMKSMDKLVDVTNRSQAHRLLTRAFNIKDIAFVIQDKGEIEIGLTTLLKNLSAHKYNVYETTADGVVKKDDQGNPIFKKDGNGNIVQVSAFEALVDNGGFTPGIRSDVAMTMDDLKAIKAETHQEYLRHQGNYAHYTQTKIESSFMGMLLTFFRKYLVPAVEVRFKGAFGIGDPRNWIQGEAQTGWWTAMADIFKYYGAEQGMLSLLPGFVTRKSGKLKTNLYYQSKALQARREAMYATLFTFLYVSLRSMVYGDDDEKKDLTWAEMQNMRLMAKVANESRSLVPIPYIGKGEDYITNFATFTTAFNEGKTVLRAFENAGYYAAYETFDSKYAYERGYYQRRAGRYEAGTPKLESNVVSLTGLENILDIFNPEYAVKKQYQKKD